MGCCLTGIFVTCLSFLYPLLMSLQIFIFENWVDCFLGFGNSSYILDAKSFVKYFFDTDSGYKSFLPSIYFSPCFWLVFILIS